jgi:hypothetical protein
VTVVSVAYVRVNLDDEAIHGRVNVRVAPRAVRASDAIVLPLYNIAIDERHLLVDVEINFELFS